MFFNYKKLCTKVAIEKNTRKKIVRAELKKNKETLHVNMTKEEGLGSRSLCSAHKHF